MQPFDKALKCGCFSNIKKFQGSLGKKWGYAKRVQKSDILTTRGFERCRIGLSYCRFQNILVISFEGLPNLSIFTNFGKFLSDFFGI